jgi:DNA-binding response OmpR family regulator
MTKILLVDDDIEFVASLKDHLEHEGFEVGAVYRHGYQLVDA